MPRRPLPPAVRALSALLGPLLAVALAGVCPAPAPAQNVVVGPEVTVDNDTRYEVFAGLGEQVVLYRDSPGEIKLAAFDAGMRQAWERDLALDRGRPTPVGAVVADGEINVLYTHRKSRELRLKLHRYSERGNLSDSLTVATLDGDFLAANWQLYRDPAGEVAVLVHQREQTTYLAMGVELATGRLLYQTTVTFEPGSTLRDGRLEVYVDERGAAYMWTQENNRRSRLDEHALTLARIDRAGAVTEARVDLSETLVFDLAIAADLPNDRLVLGGYYADDPDKAAGALVIALPYSLEGAATVTKVPFAEDLVTDVDQRERQPDGIPHLEAAELHFRRDGTVLIVGEQRKRTVRTVGGRTGYFGGTLKTDYLFEDIVLAAIDLEAGAAVWQEALPKKQFSQDDGGAFSGFFVATSPSVLRLIYNDEVRSGGTVSEYSLSGTGEIRRHSLMNTEYQDLWLRLQAGVQVSAGAIVIPSERRNRLKLVRVQF